MNVEFSLLWHVHSFVQYKLFWTHEQLIVQRILLEHEQMGPPWSSGALEPLMWKGTSLLFILSHPCSSGNSIFGLVACEDIQIFLFHTDPLACFSKLSQWPAFSCWSALAINYWCLWLYTSMCPYHRHNYQTLPQQCQPCDNITMNTICADTDSAISLLLVSKAANNLTKFGSQRWTFSFSKFQTRRELRHILL